MSFVHPPSTILLTGAAGFIGWETAKQLAEQGNRVIGVDNLNDYYDVKLKLYRLNDLQERTNFSFHKIDIEDRAAMEEVFKKNTIDAVINLAARAGVRYSMENPHVYMSTNALGTLNLLELMRKYGIKKFVLASTSSLYAGQEMPFSEHLPVNTPISPYAASKKAAEAISYSYHYLFGIDVSVLRYFTVYGPAGRPDMSPFRFIKWIDEGREVALYGNGSQTRDFTYVTDIAEGTVKALAPLGYEVINLGNSRPYSLNQVIGLMEDRLGMKARVKRLPPQKADMQATWADIGKAARVIDWKPKVSLEEGIKQTVDWHTANREWLKDLKIDLSK
jgi:nucleoside-diphosphate-sugar epimerase